MWRSAPESSVVARMAHYHCSIKSGPKGKGAEHAQYIERGGRFAAERYGEIGESERGNLPSWAHGSAARFFAVADERERANGSAYREFELALPRELDDAQRGALVREFVAQELGDAHAYVWAIHEPTGANPHVHIMFSERTRDGIERGEEQYFKRANRKQPERGGCLKSDRFSGGLTKAEREVALEDLKARWAVVQNRVLERAGSLEESGSPVVARPGDRARARAAPGTCDQWRRGAGGDRAGVGAPRGAAA